MMQLALVVLLAYSVLAEDVNSRFQSISRKDLSKSAAGMHLSKRIETIKKMAEEKMKNFQATRFPNFVAGQPLAPPKIPSIPSYSPSTPTSPSLVQVTTEITTTTAISTSNLPVEETTTTTTTIKTTTVPELTTTLASTTTEAAPILERAESSRADSLEAKSAVSEKQIRMQEILKIKEQILKERDNRRNDREKLKQEQELSRQRILQNELLTQKISEAPNQSVAEQAKPVESTCVKQNPCLNGGICIDRNDGTYECKCSSDFKGLNCHEKVLNECSSNPCAENKVCKLIDGGYQCACPVGGCETKKKLVRRQ